MKFILLCYAFRFNACFFFQSMPKQFSGNEHIELAKIRTLAIYIAKFQYCIASSK